MGGLPLYRDPYHRVWIVAPRAQEMDYAPGLLNGEISERVVDVQVTQADGKLSSAVIKIDATDRICEQIPLIGIGSWVGIKMGYSTGQISNCGIFLVREVRTVDRPRMHILVAYDPLTVLNYRQFSYVVSAMDTVEAVKKIFDRYKEWDTKGAKKISQWMGEGPGGPIEIRDAKREEEKDWDKDRVGPFVFDIEKKELPGCGYLDGPGDGEVKTAAKINFGNRTSLQVLAELAENMGSWEYYVDNTRYPFLFVFRSPKVLVLKGKKPVHRFTYGREGAIDEYPLSSYRTRFAGYKTCVTTYMNFPDFYSGEIISAAQVLPSDIKAETTEGVAWKSAVEGMPEVSGDAEIGDIIVEHERQQIVEIWKKTPSGWVSQAHADHFVKHLRNMSEWAVELSSTSVLFPDVMMHELVSVDGVGAAYDGEWVISVVTKQSGKGGATMLMKWRRPFLNPVGKLPPGYFR